jgi:hypothetical protein
VQAVLYKDKGKREELKNYRPITMLNSCYKVLATAMTTRTGAVIESLIDPDQTGFISSRHTTENIRQLMDTVHHCNTEQIKGTIEESTARPTAMVYLAEAAFGKFCCWMTIKC